MLPKVSINAYVWFHLCLTADLGAAAADAAPPFFAT